MRICYLVSWRYCPASSGGLLVLLDFTAPPTGTVFQDDMAATRFVNYVAVPGTVVLSTFHGDLGCGSQCPQGLDCIIVPLFVDGFDKVAEQQLFMGVGPSDDYVGSCEHRSSPLCWVSVFLITTLLLYNISCKRQEVFTKKSCFLQVPSVSCVTAGCPGHVSGHALSARTGTVWRCSAPVPIFGFGTGLLAHALPSCGWQA